MLSACPPSIVTRSQCTQQLFVRDNAQNMRACFLPILLSTRSVLDIMNHSIKSMQALVRSRLGRFFAVLALVSVSTWAQANYTCLGTVQVTVAPQGVVAVTGVGGLLNVYLCNLTIPINGVQPVACQGIYAMLLSAQKNAKTVYLWFNDALTCTTHPAWDWLTGWYWGPMLN